MPDTTIREGWFGSWKGHEWAARETPGVYVLPGEEPVPCVVVTGRTAQETREAFELLDNRNRIFPGCVRDA